MPKPLIYIAGPMTGLTDLNFPAFFAAAEQVEALGYSVWNPADLSDLGGNLDLPWETYIRRDIRHLVDADMMVLLPGWWDSRGATLERRIALEIDMPVFYWDGPGYLLCQRRMR